VVIDPRLEAAVAERFFAAGKTAAEIAQEFDISEATVWAIAERATGAAFDAGTYGSSAAAPEITPAVGMEMSNLEPATVGTTTKTETSEWGHNGEATSEGYVSAEVDESSIDKEPAAEMPAGEPGASSPAPPSSVGEADNAAPPAWILEAIERSVANGDSVASVARWYDVPESWLHEWLARGDEVASEPAEPVGDGDARTTSPEVLASDMIAAWPLEVEENRAAEPSARWLPATPVEAHAAEEVAKPRSSALEVTPLGEDAPAAGPGGGGVGADVAGAHAELAPDNDRLRAEEIPPAQPVVTSPAEEDKTDLQKAGPVGMIDVPGSPSEAGSQTSLSASDGQQTEPTAATLPQPSSSRYAPTVYSSNRTVATNGGPSHHSLMSFRDSLQALRRRLLVVVAGLILGVSAGWVTAPGETQRASTYGATHTLIYEPQGRQSYNIEQVALLATSGEVPSRVAARLKLDRDQVRSAVSALAKAEVATISVTGRSSTADGAVSLADVTAEELVSEIAGRDQAAFDAEAGRLTTQIESARGRLNAIPAKDTANQAAARGDLEAAERALQLHQSSAPPKSQLQTLEKAAASAISPPGVQAPDSKPVRAGLLGAVGLLVGIGGAFALDRLDSRIRSKGSAEEAFGAVVVAEVPPISKASRGQLLARTQPSSPFVEAYRGLRTYVALWAPEGRVDDGHRVIVVTSPAAGEGKTTTVAHLAAMLAEIGRSVVVVSADLRRPRLHQYFDLPGAPGLIDTLAAKPGPPVFHGLDLPTSVRGVRLVPSGAPVENPAPLFEHAGDLMRAARRLADFVLVDAPPLLIANDAVEMARHADGVLLVARAGTTPMEAAERSAEMLERLEIPVIGTVLVASESAATVSRYYASRYYAEPERTGWLRRRKAADNGQGPVAATPVAPEEVPPPPESAPPVPEEASPAITGP
jgi:Mrp family chromosome partitioning ATPase